MQNVKIQDNSKFPVGGIFEWNYLGDELVAYVPLKIEFKNKTYDKNIYNLIETEDDFNALDQ